MPSTIHYQKPEFEVISGLCADSESAEMESVKKDCISMLVHDMKAPLTNAMLGVDMVRLDPKTQLNLQQDQSLGVIKRNLYKLSEMVHNLLEISKLESGKIPIEKENLDLVGLIDRIIQRYTEVASREGTEIKVSIDQSVRRVISDERYLDRILSNLLSNAIKHSCTEGEVYLIVRPEPKSDGVLFLVKDCGEGIPKEFHDQIFEKFSHSGLRDLGHKTDTGLGLAFCRMAVEELGGRIWVNSESGKGSCFSFVLPCATEPDFRSPA